MADYQKVGRETSRTLPRSLDPGQEPVQGAARPGPPRQEPVLDAPVRGRDPEGEARTDSLELGIAAAETVALALERAPKVGEITLDARDPSRRALALGPFRVESRALALEVVLELRQTARQALALQGELLQLPATSVECVAALLQRRFEVGELRRQLPALRRQPPAIPDGGNPVSELEEERGHAPCFLARRLEQRAQGRGDGRANTQHPEAIAARASEVRMLVAQLFPELPRSEVVLADVHVVHQHDAPRAQLGEPALEVMPHGLVGVIAVDVQEIDGAVREMRERLVERALDEPREGSVERVVMGAQAFQNLRPVQSGVSVSRPSIDGVASCRQMKFRDGLADGTVRVPELRPDRDQNRRPRQIDHEHREGKVLVPRRDRGEPPGRAQADEVVERVEGSECVAAVSALFGSARSDGWIPHRARQGPSDCGLRHVAIPWIHPAAATARGVKRETNASTTWGAGPLATTPPWSSQTADSQSCRMACGACDTRTSVVPRRRIASIRSVHLRWNSMSPTESTSSTRRMSGSTSVATANPSRATMPVE